MSDAERWGYVRVSTTDQDADQQEYRLITEGQVPVGNVRGDHGITGRKLDNRPGLDELVGAWDEPRGRFIQGLMSRGDVLVVTRLDRVGRSTLDMLTFAERLKRSGIDLHILDLQIDTSTPGGELLFTVMSGLATMESRIRSERAKDGHAKRKRELTRGGGSTAKLDRPQMEEIARLMKAGASAQSVADDFGVSRATIYNRAKALGVNLRAKPAPPA